MDKGPLFGKYEVGRLLGFGASGKVYYARNIQNNGQSVAIKVINKKKVKENHVVNITREITILSRLSHPNIVCLYEVLATKTKIYFILEFAKGGELYAMVAKGRFSEELSRTYFQQLISAVGYCHYRGVYHRDLKPENLLVDEYGKLKVTDFGLSALTNHLRPDSGLLQTLCGTPAYVAPDILRKKGYDGAKVDVWSCGIILYVLTAGFLPFNDPNLMALYRKIYNGEFKCPKWMSSDLKRFLGRLLETDPRARITIDEITRDPWFRKGGVFKEKGPDFEFEFYHCYSNEDFDDKNYSVQLLTDKEQVEHQQLGQYEQQGVESSSASLNAFDLIAFSSGLHLSGLSNEFYNAMVDGETFLSAMFADKVIESIAEVARELNVNMVMRKDCVVDLYGPDSSFVARVEISQLTDQLVIVEVKQKAGDYVNYNNVWTKKFRPRLSEIIYDSKLQSAKENEPTTELSSAIYE